MPYIFFGALGLMGFNLIQAKNLAEATGEAAKKSEGMLGYIAVISAIGGAVYLTAKVTK